MADFKKLRQNQQLLNAGISVMPDQHEGQSPKTLHERGIYLLPNLFTTAAIFAGFYSIIAAVKGHFDSAAIAIYIAMVADTLDGRVARMTNTQTAFGAEYDSLSDMVAFGVAPSLLMYSWSLTHLGKLGWLAAFLYTAATALRLARFNTQAHDEDKRYFQGIPCPAAAGLVTSTVWMGFTYHINAGVILAIPFAVLTVCAAGLMVSSIRYNSFKQIDLKGKIPFIGVIFPILIITAIAMSPVEMTFGISILYALSGPVMTLWHLRRMRSQSRAALNHSKRSTRN